MGNLQAATEELAILRKLDPKLAADIEKAIAAKHEGAKSLDNRWNIAITLIDQERPILNNPPPVLTTTKSRVFSFA
jgi:hypothetical protein